MPDELYVDYPPQANRPWGMAPRPVEIPGLAEFRAWTNIPPGVMNDDTLTVVILSEAAVQLATCRLAPDEDILPPELAQALYRRVSRQIAARNLPLGLTDNVGEYGPARIPAYDAEILRLEAPRKVPVIA